MASEVTQVVVMYTLDLDAVAASVDSIASNWSQGNLTGEQAVRDICTAVGRYIGEALVDAEDVDFVVAYARFVVEQQSHDRKTRDPVLVEYFEERLAAEYLVGPSHVHLELLIASIEARVAAGDPAGNEELAELCRTGLYTNASMLLVPTGITQVLHCAHRLGASDALYAAVAPSNAGVGQIANRTRRPTEFGLAMDLLAHLAADRANGREARAALLSLAGYLDTAGSAVVRLPLHLLKEEDRRELLEIYEQRAELLANSPLEAPTSLAYLRDGRAVRNALWQADDARHLS